MDINLFKKEKIKNIFEIKTGNVLSKNNILNEKNDLYKYPVYSSQTKNNGILGYYDKWLFEKAIIWTTQGIYAGTIKYIENKFYCTNVCGVLINEKYTNHFLSLYLNFKIKKIIGISKRQMVTNRIIENIDIPIIDINKQEIIGNYFKKIDKLIEKIEIKNKYYIEFKNKYNYFIFDENKINFEYKRLKDISIKLNGGGTPLTTNNNYYDGNINFASISDITKTNKYLLSTKKTITKEGFKNSSCWIMEKNNLLYSIYASIGFVGINLINLSFNQGIVGIILNKEIANLEYIYYYLKQYKKIIEKKINLGTQKNININIVENIKTPLLSIDKQEIIGNFFKKIDEIIELNNLKIKLLIEKKNNYLNQIF